MSAIHARSTKRATAQRAEIHVGLSDEALASLAIRAVYPIPTQPAGSAFNTVVLRQSGAPR